MSSDHGNHRRLQFHSPRGLRGSPQDVPRRCDQRVGEVLNGVAACERARCVELNFQEFSGDASERIGNSERVQVPKMLAESRADTAPWVLGVLGDLDEVPQKVHDTLRL